MLQESDVHWINDRYKEYSTKSACRLIREENMASRPHDLRPSMPIIEKHHILRCSENKQRLNKLIYDSIVTDEMFLNESTENHKLVMVHENVVPQQFKKGKSRPRLDLQSSHEEADIIVTKHAMICRGEPSSNIVLFQVTLMCLPYCVIFTRERA